MSHLDPIPVNKRARGAFGSLVVACVHPGTLHKTFALRAICSTVGSRHLRNFGSFQSRDKIFHLPKNNSTCRIDTRSFTHRMLSRLALHPQGHCSQSLSRRHTTGIFLQNTCRIQDATPPSAFMRTRCRNRVQWDFVYCNDFVQFLS